MTNVKKKGLETDIIVGFDDCSNTYIKFLQSPFYDLGDIADNTS